VLTADGLYATKNNKNKKNIKKIRRQGEVMKKTFTTESVLSGHPDKLCDRISDKIVDECLHRDKHSKVAIETGVKDDNVILLGEITCNDFNNINFDKLVKEVLVDSKYNYNPRIFKYISNQSSEINHKVSK